MGAELKSVLTADDPEGLTELLTSLSGIDIPGDIIDAMYSLDPDLLQGDLAVVQALLETARHISPEVAQTWVDRVGQDELLRRISAETPWASDAQLSDEPEGLAAAADVFHISDRLQPKVHDDVVALCERLLALAPRAEVAVSQAVAADGAPSGTGAYTLATKRIRRANLPPKALPQRNRRWMTAVAERMGAQSATHYLATAKGLLDQLIDPLEDIVDGVLRAKPRDKHLDVLAAVHEAAKTLTRPANATEMVSAERSDVGVSDLQNIIFHCSADLIRDLINLPDRWTVSVSICNDIVEQIDRAGKEPWQLVGGVPRPLARICNLVQSLELVFGEAGSRGLRAAQLFGALGKKARRNNALRLVKAQAEASIKSELNGLQRRLEEAVTRVGFPAKASARLTKDAVGPWPFAKTLVVISTDSLLDWPMQAGKLLEPLRMVAGDGRQLAVVPARDDLAVPDLCFSGVSHFFPLPFPDVDWLNSLGFRLLEGSRTTTFERLAAALMEVSAIREFECATDNRAVAERATFQSALSDIEKYAAELRALLGEEATEVWNRFNSLSESIREGDIPFARLIWESMRGETPAAEIEAFSAIRLAAMEFDALDTVEA